MKHYVNIFLCFILGHKDWVMSRIDDYSDSELYIMWRDIERKCPRCGIELSHKD